MSILALNNTPAMHRIVKKTIYDILSRFLWVYGTASFEYGPEIVLELPPDILERNLPSKRTLYPWILINEYEANASATQDRFALYLHRALMMILAPMLSTIYLMLKYKLTSPCLPKSSGTDNLS